MPEEYPFLDDLRLYRRIYAAIALRKDRDPRARVTLPEIVQALRDSGENPKLSVSILWKCLDRLNKWAQQPLITYVRNKGIEGITQKGREVNDLAEKALAMFHPDAAESSRVCIGVHHSVMDYLLAEAIAPYLEAWSEEFRLEFKEMVLEGLAEQLQKGDVHFGLGWRNKPMGGDIRGVKIISLGKIPFVVVCDANHPLAGHSSDTITLDQLEDGAKKAKKPVFHPPLQQLRTCLGDRPTAGEIYFEVPYVQSAIVHARLGLGASIVPRLNTLDSLRKREILRIIPLEGIEEGAEVSAYEPASSTNF